MAPAMEALMRPNTPRRTEKLFLAADPDLRRAIEAEAVRRDTSMSSVIRAMVRAQLAILQPSTMQAAR